MTRPDHDLLMEIIHLPVYEESTTKATMDYVLAPVRSEIQSEDYEFKDLGRILWALLNEVIIASDLDPEDKGSMIRMLAPYKESIERMNQVLLGRQVLKSRG
ncbi:MAG: hypothetical protein EP346_01510 [Bacteroidetes bacterium]|nr:MAG: hypothetical protein EP346_01510 [Bacteroidota bacterium]